MGKIQYFIIVDCHQESHIVEELCSILLILPSLPFHGFLYIIWMALLIFSCGVSVNHHITGLFNHSHCWFGIVTNSWSIFLWCLLLVCVTNNGLLFSCNYCLHLFFCWREAPLFAFLCLPRFYRLLLFFFLCCCCW